ncbi:proteoglycan 4b [Synchiropus splendidus]|uniref:proteoglycan 4b n=1 Tax=Synchiropus splendidus TaxID=270530 RepID=UPI00237DD48E|nr:proteoglycan 4b [Synchiropus splendidus]
MLSLVLWSAALLACTLTSGAAQLASCRGRCGDGYYRGSICQCDYNCLRYGECCKDYESLCTKKNSCNGRCGESFQRGRKCSCDTECMKYKQCCPDYNGYCDKEDGPVDPTSYPQDDPAAANKVPVFPEGTSGSPPNEWDLTTEPHTTESTLEPTETSSYILYTDATSTIAKTSNAALLPETTSIEMTSEPPPSATTEDQTTLKMSTAPSETDKVTQSSSESSTEPRTTLMTRIPYGSSTRTSEQTEITTRLILATTIIPSTTPAAITDETETKEPTKANLDKPIPEPEMTPGEYQADDNNDTNLCSGRPISGVTTLRNGTVVVFRGHHFWFLDPNRVPGPARDITQVWGVPSPIDTVFTRCNCQGKTYILKGGKYWRFENDALDSGYPKVVETGFDGLRGPITAALSVPQHRSRREAVYFFKRGGTVQKYSYQFGTHPTCGQKTHFTIHKVHNRRVRHTVSVLEGAINIRTSWRGFPPTVTAAVSIPDKQEMEGYKYYVFSGSKSYKVRMDGGHPVMETSKPASFIKCPNVV